MAADDADGGDAVRAEKIAIGTEVYVLPGRFSFYRAPLRIAFSVFATTPCRGLPLSLGTRAVCRCSERATGPWLKSLQRGTSRSFDLALAVTQRPTEPSL